MFKKNDLIQNKRGELATVSRDGYTHRFMEAQDWDMVNGGMGEYAGVYGTAYDITYMTGDQQGKSRRIQAGKGGWKKVTLGVAHAQA